MKNKNQYWIYYSRQALLLSIWCILTTVKQPLIGDSFISRREFYAI